MSTKLAIITTEFFKEFISKALKELSFDFSYEIYIYENFRDIPALFSTIPDCFEGVITSGIFPAKIIEKSFPNTQKLITYFNSDDAGICRLFLRLFMETPNLDLSRIYGDFLDIIDVDLKEYLTSDQKLTYSELVEPMVSLMTLKNLYNIEEKQINKHLKLHQSGKADISVTRFSSIVKRLAQQGITAYVPYPSTEYLRTILEKLQQDIAIRHLEDNRPAVMNIVIAPAKVPQSNMIPAQRCFLSLQKVLLDFCGTSTLDYILQPTHFGFEVLTNRKTLAAYTEKFTRCKLSGYLQKSLDFDTHIGYGIGNDIYQARVNAINAEQEASVHLSGSYLINEKDELIGPLGKGSLMTAATNARGTFNETAKKSSLSPLTVNKVIAAINAMPSQQITAQELSFKLSITKRSANRYLSALLKSEALRVVDYKRATTKGRPEMVFKIKETDKQDG